MAKLLETSLSPSPFLFRKLVDATFVLVLLTAGSYAVDRSTAAAQTIAADSRPGMVDLWKAGLLLVLYLLLLSLEVLLLVLLSILLLLQLLLLWWLLHKNPAPKSLHKLRIVLITQANECFAFDLV